MKNLSIAARIILICTIPLLAFATMGVISVIQQNDERRLIVEMQRNIRLFSSTSQFIAHLQRERGRTALFHSNGASVGEITELRKQTDDALRSWQEALKGSSLSKGQSEAAAVPGNVAGIRKGHEQASLERRAQAIQEYSSVVGSLFALLSDIANGKTTRGFGKELTTMLLLETAKEKAGLLRANVSSLLVRNTALNQNELALIVNLKSGIDISLNSPALVLSKEAKDRLAAFQKSAEWLEVDRIFQQVVFRSSQGDYGIKADDFWKPVSRQVDDLGELVQKSLGSMESRLQTIVGEVNRSVLQLILVMVAAMGFTIFLTLGTSFYIIRGLRKVVASMHDIAEGEGDLTKRLEARRGDEIGRIASSFNTFAEKIQSLIREIAGNAEILGSSSAELSAISGQMAVGSRDISEKAYTVASASEESSANTASVAASMEQATANLASVASATEEMSATIGEIASNSEKARAISSEAVHQTQSVSEVMRELGRAAREIGQVTETITSISAQTNLLALNATIESARAGAAGKGFAVVANEIKELARQTTSATEDIKGKIASIQASTGGAMEDIEKISDVIRQLGDIVSTIAAAIEEQSVVTRDVASNIAQASMGVQDSNERVAQTATVSQEISRDIARVNTTISEISRSGEQVQSSSMELSTLAGQLKELVGRFKV